MSVKDLMELENVPVPAAKAPSASVTPLRWCTTSTADAALRAQQKTGRLALTRKPQTSIGKLSLGPSSERSNLMVASGALRSSLVETEDSLSVVVDCSPFLFQILVIKDNVGEAMCVRNSNTDLPTPDKGESGDP